RRRLGRLPRRAHALPREEDELPVPVQPRLDGPHFPVRSGGRDRAGQQDGAEDEREVKPPSSLAILCLALAGSSASPQDSGRGPRNPGSEDTWHSQQRAIEQEIAELGTHPWAGTYQL